MIVKVAVLKDIVRNELFFSGSELLPVICLFQESQHTLLKHLK